MSDIYLQITETPTVVTLSAPVVSGALASTVTVANTVTVALDSNSLSALENVTVTVGAAVTISNFPATQAVSLASVPTHGVTLASTTVTVSSLPAISGTVTAGGRWYDGSNYQPIPFLVTEDGALETVSALVQSIPAGTNRIGVVTIGGGTVTIGAGTAQIGSVTASLLTSPTFSQAFADVFIERTSQFAEIQASIVSPLPAGTSQIGSVTASISGTVPVSISSVTVGNSVTIGSLPALAAGTAQIGSVTASISNSVVTFYPLQGTTVSNTNFTSTTASTTLVSAVAGREVLTVYSEGPGQLFISPGATATTISYQVRLSPGDYWECPAGQLSLLHSAVYATAGTARVTEVS